MSCTTLTIECFKAAYTANVGYDSLFCGLKVTCDSNVKYIRAPYVADFNGNTLMLHGWDKSETVIDDVTVTGLSVAQVKDLVATCCCGDDQHLIVNNTPVGYIPTTSGNTSNLNEVVIDSGGDTWIIDINGDARKFNKGTVTSFSAGNLSPLFTTGVATPTTTPALSFNLSNCNQYQVFGRVVAGTGAPSYVTLNPIAFNGLSLPNNQIAYGTGSGISSNGNLKYNGNSGLQIGGGTNTAYCAINIGNGVITNHSDFSFVLTENTANVISGLGNAVASFIIGSGNTITTGDITSSAYHNKIFGFNNSISAAPSKYAMYNFISGRDNIVTDGSYNNILGHNVTNNGYYGCLALTDYGGSITLTASHQFTARFSGGYRFMKDGSTQWMAIAPTTGYVTINNIPTAASATDILVSNGGVVSTRTVASLGIPVITPAALTKTDDTNVTISLGGTPATALLQGVSLTMGWAGVLAITRGGTGLGSLGAANQLLRVNTGGTALEYFTPTWTTNTGTVTSVGLSASGALSVTGSPVTGSGVMTLNWTGTTSQYVRGDGSLNTFPTIPVVQWSDSLVAYGRTSVGGLTYSTGLKYDYTNSAFSVGTRAAGSVGTGSVQLGGNSVISGSYAIGLGYQNTVSGNYSTASGYNHTVLANYCFVSGNANTQTNSSGVGSFLSGREISHGTGAYLFASGYLLTVSGHYSFTVGTENTNSGTYSAIIGRNGTVTHSGNVMLLDSGSGTNITSGTSNQFTARFYNGYRFMTTNTVRAMDISSSRVVTIDNLSGAGTRMVVANASGELSTQTIPSGANSVWYIQGTATDATTNSQDIVRTGRVRIGASGSSSYMLSVVGDAYITTGTIVNNNQAYKGYSTAVSPVNLIKINSSNYVEVGQSSYDIYLPNYTSARSADTKVSTDKYMYVNASGLVKLDSDQNIRNVIGWISKTTNTVVTAGGGPTKISGSTVQQTAGGPYTTVSGNLTIPAQDRYHLITVTVQFVTTSGVAATPNITFDVYNGSGVVQDSTYIVNHDVINDTKEYSFVLQGTTAGVTSIYVRATATVAGITVQKCHMKAMDMGPV